MLTNRKKLTGSLRNYKYRLTFAVYYYSSTLNNRNKTIKTKRQNKQNQGDYD